MAEAAGAELEAAKASTEYSAIPGTSGTSKSEENVAPKDIALKVSKWLQLKRSVKLSLLKPC